MALCCFAMLAQIGNAQIIDQSAFSIGEAIEMRSELLGENRDINIYLPNNYGQDSLKKYPVIYLLDGSSDEDFIHISGLMPVFLPLPKYPVHFLILPPVLFNAINGQDVGKKLILRLAFFQGFVVGNMTEGDL